MIGGRSPDRRRVSQDSSGSERSVRKTRGERDRGRVGQLDERNLKRAVHRYGTLPKGARIGAYLESLRVMTPEPVSDETDGHDTLDSHKSGHTDPGKKSVTAEATPAEVLWTTICSTAKSLVSVVSVVLPKLCSPTVILTLLVTIT